MIRIIGPEDSKSRQLLQSLVDGIEADATITWGRLMDKLEQLKILKEAGVPVPRFSTNREELMCLVRGDVWGRKINHSQGRDIRFPGDRGYERSDYFVEPIKDVKDEWRVHIFNGLSIHSARKVWIGPCIHNIPHISNPPPWNCNICNSVRSRINGWRMLRDKELPSKVRTVAKAAVKALGWDLGAVDLLKCEDSKIYVLEVNSRPGLDNRTAEQYVRAIRRRLGV
jgi:hypothetical protein